MKKNYQQLSKQEKKEIRDKFNQSDFGKKVHPIFTRLLIISILLLLYAVVLVLDGIINKRSIWTFIGALLTFVCFLVFIISRHKIMVRNLNNYLKKTK